MKGKQIWIVVIMLGVLLAALAYILGRGTSGQVQASGGQPKYIKDVVAYKEGVDGVIVYFTLADEQGIRTFSDGQLQLIIQDANNSINYNRTWQVRGSDFSVTTLGQGNFQHQELLYMVGRLSYANMDIAPSGYNGKVEVYFTPKNGAQLYGEGTILFK